MSLKTRLLGCRTARVVNYQKTLKIINILYYTSWGFLLWFSPFFNTKG